MLGSAAAIRLRTKRLVTQSAIPTIVVGIDIPTKTMVKLSRPAVSVSSRSPPAIKFGL